MKKANSVLVINWTYPIAKLPVDSVLPVLPVLLVVPVFPPVPLSWPGCLGFPSCPSCPSCAGSPSCPGCPSWTGCPGYPGCPGCPGCPRIIYPVKDSLVRNYILSWWQSRAELYTPFRTVWWGIIYLVYQSRAELYTLFTTVSRGIIYPVRTGKTKNIPLPAAHPRKGHIRENLPPAPPPWALDVSWNL